MRKSWQVIFRMANRIQAALAGRRVRIPDLSPFRMLVVRSHQLGQRLDGLDPRLQPVATEHVHAQLVSQLQTIEASAQQALATLGRERPVPLPSIVDLVLDLVGIQEEFAACEFDLKHNGLVVTTEEIVLNDHPFGAYTIRVGVPNAKDSHFTLEVESVDEIAASNNSSVCHPHVSGGSLCLGEGRVPFEAAERDGRILDMLLIVKQVLETYNEHSAYVTLADWFGASCPECGDSVPEYSGSSCANCDSTCCDNCTYLCARCEEAFCNDCLGTCWKCDDSFCLRCLSRCGDCDDRFCNDCLDENQTCDRCKAEKEVDEVEENPNETTENHDIQEFEDGPRVGPTEIHTDRLGQADLPA